MRLKTASWLLACFITLVYANGRSNRGAGGYGMYVIKNGDDFSLKVTNYGARIVSVILPDNNGTLLHHQSFFLPLHHHSILSYIHILFLAGKLGDVVLGYDTVKQYMVSNNTLFF